MKLPFSRRSLLPRVTVICVTYRQKHILAATMRGLFQQTYPSSRYEILVLDDGSKDGTTEMLAGLVKQSPVRMRVIEGEHEADYLHCKLWNRCIAETPPATQVFVSIEDAIPPLDCIWQHAKWHLQEDHPVLVSGAKFEGDEITWDPLTDPRSSLLGAVDGPVEDGYRVMFAKCMSYSRAGIQRVWKEPHERPFDERMTGWGLLEIEFAYRMKQAGVHCVFDPAAGVFHYAHKESVEQTRGFAGHVDMRFAGYKRNEAYMLAKHGLARIEDFHRGSPITWIDEALRAQARSELLRY